MLQTFCDSILMFVSTSWEIACFCNAKTRSQSRWSSIFPAQHIYSMSFLCIFWKCIFQKCIIWKCIIWKCIFWKCIFLKCIFLKCIFRKNIFLKCIFRKCIFRKCIFRKCIFWNCIFWKCIFRKLFDPKLTQLKHFFKPSVPGQVRVFRAFASLFLVLINLLLIMNYFL